jgi:hypothetical protein
MTGEKVVVTGAAGALGSAYLRALVPKGYEVVGIGRRDQTLYVYNKIPKDPYQVLDKGDAIGVNIHGMDLARKDRSLRELFRGAYAVVMTAANPDAFQSRESAERNHRIDMNTIEAALNSDCQVIIYLSSLWRLAGLWEGDKPIRPEMSSPLEHYGLFKQKTVDRMQSLSTKNPDVMFLYNDHGWYPRETKGGPLTNFNDRTLQLWIAENETQQHILKEIEIKQNPNFDGNFHGFIVVSKNEPTEEAKSRGHRPFIFDISSSEKLGVEHTANVYDMLAGYWEWRKIPFYME